MGIFDDALAAGDVPDFNLVLPNGCEDGEAQLQADQRPHPPVRRVPRARDPEDRGLPAFGDDGVIIVTYDEDQREDGMAKKHGFGSGGPVVCAS